MACLAPAPGEVVADCTLGYGGHAVEFLKRIGPTGRLCAFDVDADQLARAQERLVPLGGHLSFHRSNFAGIDKILWTEGLDGYDIIFADLGVSSMQIDDPLRGFSYKHEGPLDMRMDQRISFTAADLVAKLSVEYLATALKDLADEPDAYHIARLIVERRQKTPITRTRQLSSLVFEAKGLSFREWRSQRNANQKDLHPAARTFQALRILVNDELGCLRQLLRIAPFCLRAGGRIGILSFHSGEAKMIDQAFHDGLSDGSYSTVAKTILPTREERYLNPRGSSAQFRWARCGG